LLLALLASALVAPAALAQSVSRVRHVVSFPALAQQNIHVRSEFPVEGDSATVQMANWTPGSYLIRDFASNLFPLKLAGAGGATLNVTRVSKESWQVDGDIGGMLVVEYDVHAGDLTVQTSWASEDFVLINGASVFLYTSATRDRPQVLTVDAPAALGRVMTPLAEAGARNRFQARDFDELVDSPVVISTDTGHRFTDGEQGYVLVNVGASELWDGSQSAADLRAIVRATNALWGELPFERDFWFFNLLVESGGGLEHDHGTVMMASRWQMLDREDYIKWLSLASHEYFHAWNVRRMRPQSLARYDYSREQYSSMLWLAEGITSYYDNLLLSRAQLVNPDEYFKRLAIDLHSYEQTPGKDVISLNRASRDAWIRHYQPDANTLNSSVSYYTKGAMLGLALDTRLRRASRDEASLDDVMRAMYRRWGSEPYPDHAFADAVAGVGGEDMRAWLAPLLETAADPDVDEALAWYGLLVDRHPVNSAARLSNKPLESGFGVNWEKDVPGLVVANVLNGMSGSKAGLLPGDELLAINGERITRDNIDDRLLRLQPGMDVVLLITRRGQVREVGLTLEESRPPTYEIKVIPDFGNRELRRMESWLGQPLQLND
jgi:predicted metalloprotease with PDZ domain